MIADKIHISHFDFLTLDRFEIDQAVGEHATAFISGCICDENKDDYKWKLLEPIWVTVTAEEEGKGKRDLMTGIIAGFSLEPQFHATRLTLILKSGTFLMDSLVHFRSFQNTGMTYLDVLNVINQTYDKAGGKEKGELASVSVDFLLQYKETDWKFIRRIASRFGLTVTPAITTEGAFYYVGSANYDTYYLPETVGCSVSKHVGSFMKQGSNGLGSLMEQDYLEYCIPSREVYNLWDRLTIGNEGGYVCRIHSEYRHGELTHTYILRPMNGMHTMQIVNESHAGRSFLGTVREVLADMVRVELTGDENTGQEITRWFPYSTGYSSPDGAGWYCMPEPGDKVRLQIPDHSEEHGYVISSVHMETGNDRKNPDHKSFKTKYGKELLFTPDSLELTNNQGMSIRIKDGEGIQIKSSKNISITSGGTMTLSSEDASLVIAGTERVDIRQGGAGLSIDKDITFTGGKFRIQ
ncbi:contractile injection system protein, VgrG/Pvc8 family [Lacrimispora sp.]|uniref:contractile injection system protein, VgrG/Pvc8 family n=1 Tax=Lacrimispora sp. TaxID=2719234 RepID=UPI0039958436